MRDWLKKMHSRKMHHDLSGCRCPDAQRLTMTTQWMCPETKCSFRGSCRTDRSFSAFTTKSSLTSSYYSSREWAISCRIKALVPYCKGHSNTRPCTFADLVITWHVVLPRLYRRTVLSEAFYLTPTSGRTTQTVHHLEEQMSYHVHYRSV